jgi:myo-inositol 2-dehydrogenase/D-chiro-inositol 1-dehydrogenase
MLSVVTIRIGFYGAGLISGIHTFFLGASGIDHRIVAVHDPDAERAAAWAARTDARAVGEDELLDLVDAVYVCTWTAEHGRLVAKAAAAGKAVFCEKPMALTLADADRAIAATRAAGVVLQVGFNRRFAPDWAAARGLLEDGRLGTPRLLRSVTRDPGGFDPSRVPPDTIFNETLIHDFDTLRFLNPGAEAVEVYATADALVEPDWRDRGLLDTAVVVVRFDNGAVGVAEACFEAAYGYDVRAEVLGSSGMATMGDGRRTGMVFSDAAGRTVETARSDQELLAGAYEAELAAFAGAVRGAAPVPVGGEDARAALAIALAAAQSVRSGRPVPTGEVPA